MEDDSEGGRWKLGMAFICTGIVFVLSCGVASVVYYTDRPMCAPPPTLENGAFHINGNGTIKAGFTVAYKCNPGFQIGETKSLTCQLWNSGGSWQPDNPPVVCTRQWTQKKKKKLPNVWQETNFQKRTQRPESTKSQSYSARKKGKIWWGKIQTL